MPGENENILETSEEMLDVTDTSTATGTETNNDNKGTEVPEKTYTQDDLNNIISKEKARIERKYRKSEESKLSRARELEETIRAGLGLEDTDDVLSKVKNFYKEQGIELPETKGINNRDAEILGRADAKDIIDTYDEKDIEARANELAIKQQKGKTNERENAEFFALGEYLTSKLEEKELKEKGVDTNILQDKGFKDFAKKFNKNVKMGDIYELWNKMNSNEQTPAKPKSTGSTQSTVPDNKDKEYYTPEEVDKLSSKDLDNPTIFKRVRESMKHWK